MAIGIHSSLAICLAIYYNPSLNLVIALLLSSGFHLAETRVQVEAVEREVFIRGFQPKVKVVVAKGKKEPIIFLSTELTLTHRCQLKPEIDYW